MAGNAEAKIWERTLDRPYAWGVFEMFFFLSFRTIYFCRCIICFVSDRSVRISGSVGRFINSVFYSRRINVDIGNKRPEEILAIYFVTGYFPVASFGLWYWNVKWDFKASVLEKAGQKGK